MAQTKYERIPRRYQHLITEDQYIFLMEICQDFLSTSGNVEEVADGIIRFTSTLDGERRFALDNLVRNIADEQTDQWNTIIISHFSKFFSNSESHYIHTDFDKVRDLLHIRVYHDSYFDDLAEKCDLIYKVDFEDTKSTLVYSYPDKFEPVKKSHFDQWNISESTTFAIAQANVNKEEIEVRKRYINGGLEQFAFFSSTYSVPFILDFQRNAGMTIGKFGAIVNIPTHGSAFAAPLNGNYVPDIISGTSEMINTFYDEDPGPITVNYYWYYENKFTKFQTAARGDGYSTLDLPRELVVMLEKNL